ncbi:hypothetical protein NM688_g3647 [Phlebia brevispora]|uniref:Uncharacterized protein n=1 Tax=Phlebia brevispora TaxID=194682 RepID=A0ACC1T4Y1_9APHY|nr:hypothetical protein NM688_g3647 [Phlebia brevispora]
MQSRAIKRKAVPAYLVLEDVETESEEKYVHNAIDDIDSLVALYASSERDSQESDDERRHSTTSSRSSEPDYTRRNVARRYRDSPCSHRSSSANSMHRVSNEKWVEPDAATCTYVFLHGQIRASSLRSRECRTAMYGNSSWEHLLALYGGTMKSSAEQQFLAEMLAQTMN